MSITIIGDNLIHYEAIGRGEPVIFVHGWLGSWRYWWPSMQALAARHRSFAFDLWGYGDSSKSAAQYHFDSYVDMLEQFVGKLIMQPATIVGHNLGAAVAVRYANEHPDRVKRVVAVSLPVEGTYIHDRLLTYDAATFINKVVGKSNSFPEIDTELRKTDANALNQLAGELRQINFVDEIDGCRRPLLLVFGDQDPVVRPPNGEYTRLKEPGNNRHFVSLDGCQHFPMLEEPAKFNRLLMEFIHLSDDLATLAPKEYWYRRTH